MFKTKVELAGIANVGAEVLAEERDARFVDGADAGTGLHLAFVEVMSDVLDSAFERRLESDPQGEVRCFGNRPGSNQASRVYGIAVPSKYVRARSIAVAPMSAPMRRPSKSSCRMWMPPHNRDWPAWSLASK